MFKSLLSDLTGQQQTSVISSAIHLHKQRRPGLQLTSSSFYFNYSYCSHFVPYTNDSPFIGTTTTRDTYTPKPISHTPNFKPAQATPDTTARMEGTTSSKRDYPAYTGLNKTMPIIPKARPGTAHPFNSRCVQAYHACALSKFIPQLDVPRHNASMASDTHGALQAQSAPCYQPRPNFITHCHSGCLHAKGVCSRRCFFV